MELIIFIFLLLLLIPFVYSGFIGAPFALTKKKVALIMIKEAALTEGDIAYDLGAGTGRFIILSNKIFSKNIYGIELVPFLCFIGKINLFINGINPSSLKFGNFYNMDFCRINKYFCFTMPKTMDILKTKFEKEAPKGALIISNAFKISGWKPEKIIKETGLPPIFVYRNNGSA
jgi:type I restriction-modification system DNA methylase subunit